MKILAGLVILTLNTLLIFIPQQSQAEERETFLHDFHLRDGSYKKLGFRIDKIKRGSIYEKIGLLNGDIIKELNHKPISSSQDSSYVFHELKTLKKINLVVRRNGQEISIHYNRSIFANN